jgi:hypothetical protein
MGETAMGRIRAASSMNLRRFLRQANGLDLCGVAASPIRRFAVSPTRRLAPLHQTAFFTLASNALAAASMGLLRYHSSNRLRISAANSANGTRLLEKSSKADVG